MSGPKVTVIGAGSFFFGKPVIHKMATSPIMAGGTLALVDTDAKVLKTMAELAKRIFAATKCGVKVIASTNRKKVMEGTDFMVLSFSGRNAHYRGIDTEITARHGIRMCSSDTIGPGGIFRALREIPHVLAMAKDVERLAPHAWMINFVNPTTVLGMALRRFAPKVKSFALCDGHHEPYTSLNWMKNIGLLPQEAAAIPPEMKARLSLRIGGVNHFTWLMGFDYDGKNMMPAVRKWLDKQVETERKALSNDCTGSNSKGAYNAHYMSQLWDIFGIMPDTISHTKEYVPYYQGYGVKPVKPEQLRLFDAKHRAKQMADAWAMTEEYASGKRTAKDFLKGVHNDHATDIIESMWGGLGKPFFINTANQGAIPNLPADAFIELRCDVDMAGPRPQPTGEMPRGVLGMQQRLLDVHELTAEAAATCDRALLRRAMALDPLCVNLEDADACITDLLAAEKDALPAGWHERSK